MSIFKKLFGRDKISRRRPVVSRGRLLGFEYLEDRRLLAIVISGNEISNAGDNGIEINGVASSGGTFDVSGNSIDTVGGTGISITGTTDASADLTVNGNTISDAGTEGILVDGFAGTSISMESNTVTDAGTDGISIEDATNVDATYYFDSNAVTGSGGDGIELNDYAGSDVAFVDNETSDNLGSGLNIFDYLGAEADFSFEGHTSDGNILDGIAIDEAIGNFDFTDLEATNNVGDGIDLNNVINVEADAPITISDSNISGNGVGNASGVEINVDNGEAAALVIESTTIDDNANGVSATASGVGSEIDLNLSGVTSISNTDINAVEAAALAGGAIALEIDGIGTMDGNSSVAGSGIELLADDLGTGDLTTLSADISNIDMTNQGGTGIEVDVNGDSNLDFSFYDSSIDGSAADQININLDVTNDDINSVVISGTTLDGAGGDAFQLSVSGETKVDVDFVGNEVIEPADQGAVVNADGTSQTRIDILGNDFVDNAGQSEEGVQINVSGDAELLGDFFGNLVEGFGTNGNPTIMAAGAVPDPDWAAGLDVNVFGDAVVGLTIENNAFVDNGLEGAQVQTFGGETSLFVSENLFDGNDLTVAIDTTPDPDVVVKAPFQQDFLAEGNGGTMNLALDGNDATSGYVVDENFGGAIEYEDGTNSPTVTTLGGVTVTPFDPNSSDTLDNIDALAGDFIADGFPPQ